MAKAGELKLFVRNTGVIRCDAFDCRFNAMNLYGNEERAGAYCAFQAITISRNAQCQMFEDCADHGKEPNRPPSDPDLYDPRR